MSAVRCALVVPVLSGDLVIESSQQGAPSVNEYVLCIADSVLHDERNRPSNLFGLVTAVAWSRDHYGPLLVLVLSFPGGTPSRAEFMARGAAPVEVDLPWRGRSRTTLN